MSEGGKIDFVKILSMKHEINLRVRGYDIVGEEKKTVYPKRRVLVRETDIQEQVWISGEEGVSHSDLPTREELLAELERVGEPPRPQEIETPREPRILEKTVTPPFIFRILARVSFRWPSLVFPSIPGALFERAALVFGVFLLLVSFSILSAAFVQKTRSAKAKITGYSFEAYGHLDQAKTHIFASEFLAASKSFEEAGREFGKARETLGKFTGALLHLLDFLPFGTPLSSGNNLLEAGEALSRAGEHMTYGMAKFQSSIPFLLARDSSLPENGDFPTDRLILAKEEIRIARVYLEEARIALEDVRPEALPTEIQPQVSELKEKLPVLITGVDNFLSYSDALLLFLGHDNPRTYLVLFQNPSEIRATGGFIGSYGVLEIDRGMIGKFTVDDVYNLDGQLFEKVVPPRPIQSISTAWSVHDANWFFDFPESARHISTFFEKAGGATPDGVITLNTNVLRKLVELTGPIPLPLYGVTLDSSNIVEELQEEIELTYDTHLNQPKKILIDLGPLLLGRIGELSSSQTPQLGELFLSSLTEKDILLFSRDSRVEEMILDLGWGGNIIDTPKDYLAVVHSNINGFKTDWVIGEQVFHTAEISPDGEVIDTVAIIRKHEGGSKEFYNKVNKDYLRVYVPEGSELLEASGHTVEEYTSPIDYAKSLFSEDPILSGVEKTFRVHPESGTQIFEESGKTVFGNWAFVSPGETVLVTYRYKLPFRLHMGSGEESYSLTIQKQPSMNPEFKTSIKLPEGADVSWKYPESIREDGGVFTMAQTLEKDILLGIIFKK